MSDVNTPGDSNAGPGEPTDEFGFADDFGVIRDPTELSPEDEDYRRRAYAAVAHYARDYQLKCFPVWWADLDGTCACPEGINCSNKGKHPIDFGWPEVATSDPEQAARWWRPLAVGEQLVDWRPKSNVGLLMGDKHFLLDVDTDGGKTGDLTLGALISHHGADMPHTLMYQTGGGGRQHVMLIPDGIEVRQSISELGDFLDVKGIRSYGIAPPSRSGKGEYTGVIDAPPELPPEWLATWLAEQQRKREERIAARPKSDKNRQPPENLSPRARVYVEGAMASAVKTISGALDGQRNDVLNTEAFNLFAKFGVCGLLDPGEIAAGLKDAASACGLSGEEIPRTLQSAWAGAEDKDRSGELPPWVFEAPAAASGRIPSLVGMVYEFERLYNLRRATGGEFISRPATRDQPPLVGDIGDELSLELRWWWRTEAEEWNRRMAEIVAAAAADPEKKDEKVEGEEYCQVLPVEATFSNAISHLKASANRHPRIEQHLRVLDSPGQIVVDLCNDMGEVVLITPEGFEVGDPRDLEGDPWFRRNDDMLAQIRPADPGGVLEVLAEAQDVIDLDDEQWKVALGGLIGAYFPSRSRPGWWFTGPSGSGKTTRGQMLAGWVDPVDLLGGQLDLRRDERNARTAASNSYVYSMDNVTSMSQQENDWWCRLHTGARETARKLHSDNTQLSWKFKRIGLATSLVLPDGLRPDAMRRTLLFELAGTDKHPDVSAIEAEYDRIKPRTMGGLFTVLAGVLAHLDKARAEKLDDIPEMADYARILFAADLAFPGLGGLYPAYVKHASEVLVRAGLEDQLTLLIMSLVNRDATRNDKGEKKLTALPADLFKALRKMAGEDVAEEWFPADPTRLGERLTNLDGPLRRLGIVVTRAKHSKRGTPYVFTKIEGPKGDAGDAEGDAGK